MKAMIFAAGVGSRLGELTQQTPKCLVSVGGEPILGSVIERLKEAGVRHVMINLHHMADQVKAFLHEREYFGIDTHFSFEPELLDTGGGLKKAEDFFVGEPAFLIHNADIYSEIDLKGLVSAHLGRNAAVTLAVREADDSRRLLFDDVDQLCGWENRNTGQNRVVGSAASEGRADIRGLGFCGVSVGSPALLDALVDREAKFSIIEPFLDLVQDGQSVIGVTQTAPWIDIGTPEDLARIRAEVGE